MKSIYTLVPDIQYLLTQTGWVSSELRTQFGSEVGLRLAEQFQSNAEKRGLRLSRMGPQCPCALWHSVHHPELAEPLPPWAQFKYSFGHIIEAQAIMMARASGHLVTGEQDEVSVDGILGHRDCVIDGCIVDVKSVNGRGFEKWKSKAVEGLDDWGYLSQLDAYLLGSADDPLVTVKDRGYILAIHKELGHMTCYEHKLRADFIKDRVKRYKEIVAFDKPPTCTCRVVPEGKSGNYILAYPANYSPYKFCCYPNIRTFIYARGPVYFTQVMKRPRDATEVDKLGRIVYNG